MSRKVSRRNDTRMQRDITTKTKNNKYCRGCFGSNYVPLHRKARLKTIVVLATCDTCMVSPCFALLSGMLLRAALRRNRICKPIEALTDFKQMLPEKVVPFAEMYRVLARVAWHWLQRRASQRQDISNKFWSMARIATRGLCHRFASFGRLRFEETKVSKRTGRELFWQHILASTQPIQ